MQNCLAPTGRETTDAAGQRKERRGQRFLSAEFPGFVSNEDLPLFRRWRSSKARFSGVRFAMRLPKSLISLVLNLFESSNLIRVQTLPIQIRAGLILRDLKLRPGSLAIRIANPAIVGFSKRVRSGISTSNAFLRRDMTWVARSEWPPNSKKLS